MKIQKDLWNYWSKNRRALFDRQRMKRIERIVFCRNHKSVLIRSIRFIRSPILLKCKKIRPVQLFIYISALSLTAMR
jgi:hypothetical protein